MWKLTNLGQTDLDVSPWQEGETNPAEKFRKVAFTIPLSNNIGVKSTRAVESQVNYKSNLRGIQIWR
jgi:hypothetical protein